MTDCKLPPHAAPTPSGGGSGCADDVGDSACAKGTNTTCHIRASATGSHGSSRLRWASLAGGNNSSDGGTTKPSQRPVQAFAPILVSCGGSDEGETSCSSSDQQQGSLCHEGGLLQHKGSVTSTLDGMDSGSCSPHSFSSSLSRSSAGLPTPATLIAQADVQAGCLKTGVRYCLETWPTNPVLKALDAFLAMSSMFGYTATILLILVLGSTACYTRCWPLGVFIASLVLSVFLPAEPLLWHGFQNSTLVSSWRRYFQFSFVLDHKLAQDRRYIFAAFPHGVFPVSELLCISLMMRIWPRLRCYSICASSVFKVPVWRHILCWTGARPATKHDFMSLLKRGSVSLVPGGIAEMFLWQEHKEAIKILDRKGFVRIAVATGTPLVPVYHFGNSKLFSWVAPDWLEGLSRRARVAVGYPKGRWSTLMPCNAPLMMAVGAPIEVPHIAPGQPGFDAAVDAAHEALVKALVDLYTKYKGLYGWQDRELVVS